jgi:hypothetical protein
MCWGTGPQWPSTKMQNMQQKHQVVHGNVAVHGQNNMQMQLYNSAKVPFHSKPIWAAVRHSLTAVVRSQGPALLGGSNTDETNSGDTFNSPSSN